jgi:hypothetical protein
LDVEGTFINERGLVDIGYDLLGCIFRGLVMGNYNDK